MPDARVERSAVNIGFAAGHNRAMALEPADVHILLNPDCRLAPAFIERSIQALEMDATIGAVSGRLLRFRDETPDGGPLEEAFGRRPGLYRDGCVSESSGPRPVERSAGRGARSRCRRRIRHVGGGCGLSADHAGGRRVRRRVPRRGLLRLPRGRRPGLASPAPRVAMSLRARCGGAASPSSRTRPSEPTSIPDQPTLGR